MMRRFLVVLAAVVLGASVLVVAGSPVGAANTASEVLSDHDNNAATPVVREFAGANRYVTSVALAEAYVESVGSGGFADSVIVASGESVIDAAAAAGLAASKSAPVLLTTPNRLSRAVENFIVDEFISEVFIVGGLEAVSQGVEDALADLATVRTVTRLSGPDRYATSVALAEEMGTPGVYCDSGQVTAILVNVDDSFADVIAVGPLAYALELPVLLTRANALPDVVSGYLVDAEIERVVIVGGETAVSEAVVTQLTDVGVTDVVRISGANRYATALAIRDALADCATLSVSSSRVALVNGDAPADGVAAGPYLGSGDDGVVPVLLVQTGQLPSDTSDYLASIPVRTSTATFVDLDIIAIGGTDVVPASVMQAAIDAATTSEPLTATIKATAGQSSFTITFSGNVNPTDAVEKANYRVGGAPLLFDDAVTISGRTVTVVLDGIGDAFVAGTTISVLGGKIRGAGGDKRRVEAATYTVPRTVPDNLRPNVRITAPANANIIRISVTEASLATTASTFDVTNIERDGDALTTAAVHPDSTDKDLIICLFGLDDAGTPADPADDICVADGSTLDPAQTPLAAGERITLAANAFADTSSNNSRTTSARVAEFDTLPRVTRATVSRPVTSVTTEDVTDIREAFWQWVRYVDTNPNNRVVETHSIALEISAKAGGFAGGAAGNDWGVQWFALPDDADTVPEVSVNVFGSRRTLRIGFDDDATLDTALTALRDNTEVANAFRIGSSLSLYMPLDTVDLSLPDSAPACLPLNRAELRQVAITDGQGYYDCNQPTTERIQLAGGTSEITAITPVLHVAKWEWFRHTDTANSPGGDTNTRVDAVYNMLAITAKADGPAGGAAGNAWYVEWFALSDDDDAEPVVSVNLYESRKTIRIGFDDDATLNTAITALLDNKEVGELFSITSDAFENTELATTDLILPNRSARDCAPYGSDGKGNFVLQYNSAGKFLAGGWSIVVAPGDGGYWDCGWPSADRRQFQQTGQSTVTVTLTYNGIVQGFDYGGLKIANKDASNYPTDVIRNWGSATGAPDNKVSFTLSSSAASLFDLPKSGGTINLPADLAYSYVKSGTDDCVDAATCQSSVVADNYRLRAG